jgi:hypothetical protein
VTKDAWIRRAVAIEERLRRHREREEQLLWNRRKTWLMATEAGATYSELKQAVGMSDGLLIKELRRARLERLEKQ